jgi:hypothetical protein
MKRLSIMISMLLAWLILGDKKGRRFVTGSLITAGTIILASDPRGQAHVLNSAEAYALRFKQLLGR